MGGGGGGGGFAIALFPGLLTIQFLIACSMQKLELGGPGSIYHVSDVSVHLRRQRGEARDPQMKEHIWCMRSLSCTTTSNFDVQNSDDTARK